MRTDTLTAPPAGPFVRRLSGLLPSRAADNLYWLGRYVERAEAQVHKLRAYHLRLEDAVVPLVEHLGDYISDFGTDIEDSVPLGLLDLFDAARGCAGKIRDRFSTDGWHALDDLSGTAHKLAAGKVTAGDDAARAMSVLLRKLAGFSGLVHENMFRDTGWRFLTMGRALERADNIASLLVAFADRAAPPGSLDVAVEVGDSVMIHRRRYSVETSRNTVIDLLALDPDNPRSLICQTRLLREQEAAMPRAQAKRQMSDFARQVLRLDTDLAVAVPEEITTARLTEMRAEIADISDALTALYLG